MFLRMIIKRKLRTAFCGFMSVTRFARIATGYLSGVRGLEFRVPIVSRIFDSQYRPSRVCGTRSLRWNGYSDHSSGRDIKLTTDQLVQRSIISVLILWPIWSELVATEPEASVRFLKLPHFLRSCGSVTRSTHPHEDNWAAT
jgi:hypothetical protein